MDSGKRFLGTEFIHGSINVLATCLLKENQFDDVYHLAAYAAEELSHFIKGFSNNNNLIGSVDLMNAAIDTGGNCLVFGSSIAVEGISPELPVTEESMPDLENSSRIAKLAVDQELKGFQEMFELICIIFGPHKVHEERQNIGINIEIWPEFL